MCWKTRETGQKRRAMKPTPKPLPLIVPHSFPLSPPGGVKHSQLFKTVFLILRISFSAFPYLVSFFKANPFPRFIICTVTLSVNRGVKSVWTISITVLCNLFLMGRILTLPCLCSFMSYFFCHHSVRIELMLNFCPLPATRQFVQLVLFLQSHSLSPFSLKNEFSLRKIVLCQLPWIKTGRW